MTENAGTENGDNAPTLAYGWADKQVYTADYQLRDDELFDYGFYELDYLPRLRWRGPALDVANTGEYVSCLGAAQTLGVYADNPFPQLLRQKFGIPFWNLGAGGADPGFYLQHPELFPYINKSKFVILQVMTARNAPNDRIGRTRDSVLGIDKKRNEITVSGEIWQRILEEEPEKMEEYIQQSRDNWERELEELIEKITVPILHFWFSNKKLDQAVDAGFSGINNTIDLFPQFISGENLGPIERSNQPLVTCYSDRNMVFPLLSKHSGKKTEIIYNKGDEETWRETENIYYPSPEMHWDAAEILIEAIKEHNLLA